MLSLAWDFNFVIRIPYLLGYLVWPLPSHEEFAFRGRKQEKYLLAHIKGSGLYPTASADLGCGLAPIL